MSAGDAEALDAAYRQGVLTVHAPALESLPHPALLHAGEDESIRLAIELEADWLLMDDLRARQIAQRNLTSSSLSTNVKGTLGVIVTATQSQVLSSGQAVDFVEALKGRPDIWLAPSLCEAVIKTLQRLP